MEYNTDEFTCPIFNGFYCSRYSLDERFTDDDMFNNPNNVDIEILEYVRENAEVQSNYYTNVAQTYIDTLHSLITEVIPNFTMKYKNIVSPKYYNYYTDRIYGMCNFTECQKEIINIINKNTNIFKLVLEKYCTTTSGFISYYSNNINEWDLNRTDLDCNEIGLILEVLAIIGYKKKYYDNSTIKLDSSFDIVSLKDLNEVEDDIDALAFEDMDYAEFTIDFIKLANEFNLKVVPQSFDDLEHYTKLMGEYVYLPDNKDQLKLFS